MAKLVKIDVMAELLIELQLIIQVYQIQRPSSVCVKLMLNKKQTLNIFFVEKKTSFLKLKTQ